jgi:hypothetical protein
MIVAGMITHSLYAVNNSRADLVHLNDLPGLTGKEFLLLYDTPQAAIATCFASPYIRYSIHAPCQPE